MADVVNRVDWLAVAGLSLVLNARRDGLVFSRSRIRRFEVTARIKALEDRGVEARVATLDLTLRVLHPHEHVVWVEVVLAGMRRIRVVTETQRVVALWVGLAVNRLEDVLGVSLEHLLRLFRQLVRVVLELRVESLVCRSTVLRQGRCEHGVAISRRVLRFRLRASCREAPVWATTSFKPHPARKDV